MVNYKSQKEFINKTMHTLTYKKDKTEDTFQKRYT